MKDNFDKYVCWTIAAILTVIGAAMIGSEHWLLVCGAITIYRAQMIFDIPNKDN